MIQDGRGGAGKEREARWGSKQRLSRPARRRRDSPGCLRMKKSKGTTPKGPWTAPFPAARRARLCAAVSRLKTLQLDPRRAAGRAAVSPAAHCLVWQPCARHPNNTRLPLLRPPCRQHAPTD